ncbi:MAG: PIN domain-containing protein [Candidatus Nanopelagicales bacterium]|nr:PIN domain-containing protein [Candidatus Nanopelagicales bacterium]MCU0294745.1 PIN domain-containing protein [Candidatus Nanopelagicales bacterium]MCU0298483.1 PIN domain-containing protein [Candidatus Nanopelagicales bacterium]
MTLLDTSVAVAVLVAGHAAHERTLAAIPKGPIGLAGHAVFETLSVLTRLPGYRLPPAAAAELVRVNFPMSVACVGGLDEMDQMAARALAGGQVYDALIALAARGAGRKLLTRDARALPVYAAVGAEAVLIE